MGAEERSLKRLKGVYRSSWTRHQLLCDQLRTVLDTLIEVEIVPMMLRGMRLATAFYDEPALRPIRHIELVVEPSEFDQAVDALRRLDWSMVTPVAPVAHPEQAAFGSPTKVACVLANELPRELRAARRGWGRATRARGVHEQFEGRSVLVLDPLDELFLAASGWRKPAGILQALVDTHTMIKALGPDLGWHNLATRSADRALSYRVLELLSYLRATLQTPIPDYVLGDLTLAASTGRERLMSVLEAMDGGVLGGFPGTLAEFTRTAEATSAAAAIHGLPSYLQHVWGINSAGHVPVQMIKKGASRLRSRRQPTNAA